MAGGPQAPLLRIDGIEKSFPGVRALRGVSLEVGGGEVVALVGENGAGKSTLIKILAGALRPEAGSVAIDGAPADLADPVRARAAGIGVIFQEFNLVPDLTVRENLFLGREKTRRGFIDRRAEEAGALHWFRRLGMAIDPDARCRDLTVAAQQTVEIARALATDARLLVMDEPTASLSGKEVGRLLDIVRELRASGIGVLYVSHRLEEIFALADRAVVLRDGELVGAAAVADLDRRRLIEMMVGRPIEREFPPRPRRVGPGRVRLRAENLCRGTAVRGVSFELREGEVLGLAGLVGAGRTETARLVFGADRPDSGRVEVDGAVLPPGDPRAAIRRGVCLLTEDRKGQGLILMHSVRENFGLPNLRAFRRGPFIDRAAERAALESHVDSLRIRIRSPGQRAAELSGGNQQKVVLAKWLQRHADVLIFDEPTRGIDVGAKLEIYQLINTLVAEGKAVLLISSELPEVLGMCDRILVLHEGRLRGQIDDVPAATQEDFLALALAP